MSFVNYMTGGNKNETLRSRLGKVLVCSDVAFTAKMTTHDAERAMVRLYGYKGTDSEEKWARRFTFFFGPEFLLYKMDFTTGMGSSIVDEYAELAANGPDTENPNPQHPEPTESE